MRLPYMTLDVFTDRRFGGNPLAVVFDADGLSTEEMQLLAREFAYSETTFVCRPSDPANTAKVRIFTPSGELPFAGHPNIGTAVALALQGRLEKDAAGELKARFEEAAGLVPLSVRQEAGLTSARLTSPKAFSIARTFEPSLIARMVDLDAADIALDRHPPLEASCGNPFMVVEVKSLEALTRLSPRIAYPEDAGELPHGLSLYARCGGEGEDLDIRTRMFAEDMPAVEDPATGSAAVVLAGVLATQEAGEEGRFSYRIGQGMEMGRPSLLLAEADKQGGAVTATHVGGSAVPVFEGWLTL